MKKTIRYILLAFLTSPLFARYTEDEWLSDKELEDQALRNFDFKLEFLVTFFVLSLLLAFMDYADKDKIARYYIGVGVVIIFSLIVTTCNSLSYAESQFAHKKR